MGNWRTVHLTGKCAAGDVAALRAAITPDEQWLNMGPLSNMDSLCGLGDWAREEIEEVGNLAERDYSVEDVAGHLRRIVEQVPSLVARIDCGGDYESKEVVATVLIGEDRTVAILPPQAELIPDAPEGRAAERLMNVLGGRTRW